jgi:hypothetical protein
MFASLLLLTFATLVGSTITSDTGCSCVVTKTAVTAPGAGSAIAAGCANRTDWLGQPTTWCLTDQSQTSCGTLQPGFGYVDTCQQATVTALNATTPQVEWDQTPTTFYTGQLLNITWSTNNIQPDEQFRLTYMGSRTITIAAATNNSAAVSARLSDATSSLTSQPVSIQMVSLTNPSIAFNSVPITVLQSKLQNVNVYNNGTLVNTGTVTILGQNLSITWRALGEAQFGVATVVIRSGGGTTVGTQITNVVPAGNNTVYYNLPMTFTPSGFTTYSAQITVTGPNGPYTASSAGFRLAAGPTPSPTSSTTPTRTPSQTASNTPTKSITPSITPSQTPTTSTTSTTSVSSTTTPSLSPSSTPSQTPAPSVDIIGAARAAAEEANNKNAAIAGSAVGGLCAAALVGLIAYKVYERKMLRERRLRKHRASLRTAHNRELVYGVSEEKVAEQPTVVMYQIQGLQQQRNSAHRNQLATYQSRNNRP